MVAYTGSQSSVVSLQPVLNAHTNDISLRFKTPKRTGLLFVASSRGMKDYISAYLDDGLVKLKANIGDVLPVSTVNVSVHDSSIATGRHGSARDHPAPARPFWVVGFAQIRTVILEVGEMEH